MTSDQQTILDAWGIEFNKALNEGKEPPSLPKGFFVAAGSWQETRNEDGSVNAAFRIVHESDRQATAQEIFEAFKSGRGLDIKVKLVG